MVIIWYHYYTVLQEGLIVIKKIAKTIRFPEEIEKKIAQYQVENGISTFTSAVMELIRKGLAN